MNYAATTAEMKELDRVAIQERGIPSLELMENAARAVAQEVVNRVGLPQKPKEGGVGVIGGAVSCCVLKPVGEELTPEEQREAEELQQIVESRNTDPTPRIGVFCGPGNNGGDGVAVALSLIHILDL